MRTPAARSWTARCPSEQSPELFLDRIRQPFGPCPAASEAADAMADVPQPFLAARLRHRLAQIYRVPEANVSLFASADSALTQMVGSTDGPLIGFPPSDLAESSVCGAPSRECFALARGQVRTGAVPLDLAMDLPAHGVAIVDSPSNPLGSMLATSDAVRLARACRFLIVDERYGEMASFSLLHLSVEFDNVAIVRSFEYWAGFDGPPCSWVAASPRAAAALGLAGAEPCHEAIAKAVASLANLDTIHATLRGLRDERSRLFRFLRKLSFMEPIPSWGPFMAARIHLVSRDEVVSGLARRGVHVHAPELAGLESVVRIGIGTRSSMDRLQAALLELASELLC